MKNGHVYKLENMIKAGEDIKNFVDLLGREYSEKEIATWIDYFQKKHSPQPVAKKKVAKKKTTKAPVQVDVED